jgi:hypothetical protein
LDAQSIPKPWRGKVTGFTDLQVHDFVEPSNKFIICDEVTELIQIAACGVEYFFVEHRAMNCTAKFGLGRK